ncbi:MAG: DUF2628 domain-containing protein [Curvibacter lanceolatus]|uniref:DUF2628 domain-containing protein n=1 Tax=Curvibacter lanceolatus TaxID=86182 RepID=UPI000A00FA82|nr:DUF2628 domain-containing protein [Curvibacter lanceolatus]MBV5292867.1 DUF2628 domain-containing protein [Curvibacter lanceolatus]
MSTVFCRGCGQPVTAVATSCPNCGAQQATPQATQRKAEGALSDKWVKRFALIQKAGGAKLPALGKLPMSERLAIKFNILGFLFGPFYYAFLGMWKRALTMLGVGLSIVLIGEVVLKAVGAHQSLASFFMAGFFAGKVNLDYFKKQILNDNGWW